jgi:hypothetical protein
VFHAPAKENDLEGVITAFSDSGSKSFRFAVIEVTLKQMVIVPIEKVHPFEASNSKH